MTKSRKHSLRKEEIPQIRAYRVGQRKSKGMHKSVPRKFGTVPATLLATEQNR